MDWVSQHLLELAAVGIYTLLLVYHGWQGNRRTRGVDDFYIGGRSMGGIELGLSFYATYFSTNSMIGFAGQSYTVGFSWLLMGVVLLACSIASWHLIAPRFRVYTARLKSLTIPDFFGFRYQSLSVRMVASLIMIFASLFYMAAIFKGIGETLSAFFGISYQAAVWAVVVLVLFYTALGGYISVVKTDAVQGLVILFASVLMFFSVLEWAGGWGTAVARLSDLNETLPDGRRLGEAMLSLEGTMPLAMLLGISFAGGIKFLSEPRQISRFYALRDGRALKAAMIVGPTAIGISYMFLLPVGAIARGIIPPEAVRDTDQVVPLLLTEYKVMGSLGGALMLTAFIAAAMSSLDSVLLIVSGTFQRDIVEFFVKSPSERAMLRRTRAQILAFCLLTGSIALNPPGNIVKLTVFSGTIFGACFFPPLIFGLFWKNGTKEAALASLLVGLATSLVWSRVSFALPLLANVHDIFAAIALSTLAFIITSLAMPAEPPAAVRQLFQSQRSSV